MARQNKAKIPMWEISGNAKIKEFARNIVEVSAELYALNIDLQTISRDLEIFKNRINIYLSNIFHMPGFEQSKYAVSIKEDSQIFVYNKEDIISNKDFEDAEPVYIHKSSKRQVSKIIDVLCDYNDHLDEFDELLEEYELTAENHKEMWKEAKLSLKSLSFMKIHNPKNIEDETKEIEEYDEEKHVLVITMNNQNDWNFKYIRKEDEDRFNKTLHKKNKKET